MSDTFYRLHSNPNAPCFCAEHAWSGLWGGEWNEDGSATHCNRCGGTGFDGEPLAVPTGKVRWITWKELKELALKEEAVA